jgi:hypothetical protein
MEEKKTFNRHKLDHRKQIFLFLLLVHIHRKQIEISCVNFINVLRAAFTLTDPKSIKYTDNVIEFLHFRDRRE